MRGLRAEGRRDERRDAANLGESGTAGGRVRVNERLARSTVSYADLF